MLQNLAHGPCWIPIITQYGPAARPTKRKVQKMVERFELKVGDETKTAFSKDVFEFCEMGR